MNGKAALRGVWNELRLMVARGRSVWKLVPHRHKLALAGAAMIMALTSVSNTALPLLLGRLVDAIQAGTEHRTERNELFEAALWILGAIAVVYVVREVLHVLRRFLVENACTRINRDISLRLIAHTLKLDLATLTKDKVGALQGRIFHSVEGLVRFLRLAFLDFLPAILTGLFALTAAVAKQPILGLAMAGVVPISVVLTMRQLTTQKGVRLQLMHDCETISGAVVEQLGGIEYIRVANTLHQEMGRLRNAMEKRRHREMRHHFAMSLFGCGKALNEGFFHIIVLAAATYFALRGDLTYGDIVTFSILFLNVMAPLNEIHRVIDEGHESSLRVGLLLEMLAEPTDISFEPPSHARQTPSNNGQAGPRLIPNQPVIAMDDLQAEYTTPKGDRKRALDGIDLVIRHGETIGIAGRSGCGKSTWVKCLLRLTHPCGGRIVFGGVDLERITRAELAHLVGYVEQNPFIFSGTIADNIAYGNDSSSRQDIERVARLANLHDEIMEMPAGYDAPVAERGQNLSGGQRQRLAIARILLKQAPVLILDEATSALDNISERHVQRALGLTRDDRTTIIVAHRLSTLRDADRILVFQDGRILEVGTYDALVQQGGIFTQLVMSAENGISAS
jgi:ATP-binding cassette subfamily B protein